ncbi:hypothetical protein [uncultured Nostoc sp.]|uniref:hypothetical protein n=1 Tax=uncultured Nostoc sp. TaxID=340711 RepID=UPI0035C9FB7C
MYVWVNLVFTLFGGTKVYESGHLRKPYGKNTFDFNEGDLISKLKGQATEVKHFKSPRWVSTLLCFTKSNVDIPRNEVSGIYVVNANDLVNTLLHIEKSQNLLCKII